MNVHQNGSPLLLIPLLIIVFIVNFIATRFMHYECPQCQAHFQTSVADDMFKPHYFGEREETCPHCGYTGLMRRHSGKN